VDVPAEESLVNRSDVASGTGTGTATSRTVAPPVVRARARGIQ
jgi:hypothetical protein